jgi:hypothetical protein
MHQTATPSRFALRELVPSHSIRLPSNLRAILGPLKCEELQLPRPNPPRYFCQARISRNWYVGSKASEERVS